MTLDAETQKVIDQIIAQLPDDYAEYLSAEVASGTHGVSSILSEISNAGFCMWCDAKANAIKVTRP